MQVAVESATGVVLDWLVAVCEGALMPVGNVILIGHQLSLAVGGDVDYGGYRVPYAPSTDWAQGGPIIEREDIGTSTPPFIDDPLYKWVADHAREGWRAEGPTLLIAAMRCYVMAKLGPLVEIPDELC